MKIHRPIKLNELDSKTRTKIVSALRKVWRNSPQRKAVVERCAVNKKLSRCEGCGNTVHKKLLEIDHITPIGGIVRGCNGDWNLYIERLMFGELQGLCEGCHSDKTHGKKEVAQEEELSLSEDMSFLD